MNKLGNIVKKLLDYFILIALSVMVILVFINVVLRYALNSGIPEAEELSRFFFMWTVFLGIIVAYKDDEHVSVTLLVDNIKGLLKKIINSLAFIVKLLTIIFILYGGIKYTILASTYKTAATGTNFAVITVAIVVMAISMLILDFKKICDNLKKIKSGGEQE